MKIGIVGSGMIGSTLGRLWRDAGHEVRYGARDPDATQRRLRADGIDAAATTVADAAAFADVVFTAAPYGTWPELAPQIAPATRGKVVIDAANPYPERDGAFARDALASGDGAGVPVARLLPDAHLVRAFSTVYFQTLRDEAHRDGDRVGIPYAGDDPAALETTAALIRDAGFDPVATGDLRSARLFDPGTPVYNTGFSGRDVRATLATRS